MLCNFKILRFHGVTLAKLYDEQKRTPHGEEKQNVCETKNIFTDDLFKVCQLRRSGNKLSYY